MAGASYIQQFKQLVVIPSHQRRYILALVMQAFTQTTSINGINNCQSQFSIDHDQTENLTDSPTIFQAIGIKGTSTSLLATGLLKTAITIGYVLVVDRSGSTGQLVLGQLIRGQLVDHFWVNWPTGWVNWSGSTGLGQLVGHWQTGAIIQVFALLYLTIYLGVDPPHTGTLTSAAGRAGAAMLYIYSIDWAIGWSPNPWLFVSEVFPTSVRSVGVSTSITFNCVATFAVTRATPTCCSA